MKKKLIAIIGCLVVNFCHAQVASSYFQVMDNNYVQFENLIAETEIQYYSTVEGGVLLKTNLTNSEGNLKNKFGLNETPCFALNARTNEHPNGTNFVYELDKKDFIVKDIKLDVIALDYNLTWNAQINAGKNVSFKILKSKNNEPFNCIETITGISNNNLNDYSFKSKFEENELYKIQIVDDNEIVRYESEPLNLSNFKNNYRVYPTTRCQDILYVDINNDTKAEYFITNINGTFITSGQLTQQYNKLSISDLQVGSYFIVCKTNSGINQSYQFSKD